MNTIVAVFLGLIIGAVIIGLAGFLYFLFKAVVELRLAVSGAVKSIDSLKDIYDSPGMRALPGSVGLISQTMPAILDGVTQVSKLLGTFNQLVFKQAAIQAPEKMGKWPTAPEDQSSFTPYSDDEAAAAERSRILRQNGADLPDEETPATKAFFGYAPPPPPLTNPFEAGQSKPVEAVEIK